MMKNNIKSHYILFILLLFGLIAQAAPNGGNPSATAGIFDQMNYQELIDLTLSFDKEELIGNRRNEEDHDAVLSFTDASGKLQEWAVELNLRGHFRRIKCSEMPPLKIKFKKKALKAAGLAPYNDMKLVTYCMDDYRASKESLLKEYLTYKLYNQITEASFRVQLLNITYKDTRTGKTEKQFGFLIEDTAQLRARMGADKSENDLVNDPMLFDETHRKKVGVFQYMIGNADWIMTYSKNVKYIVVEGKIIPIPYDFDFSALVDAPYALFVGTHGQKNFYDRVYLGFERNYEELKGTIYLFEEKKEALYQTVQDFKLLKLKSRMQMIDYLDSFFQSTSAVKFSEKMIKNPVLNK